MSNAQVRYRVFGRDGFVDHTQMRDLIRRGEVTSLSDIAREGSEQWQAAADYAELQRYFALVAAERRPLIRRPTRFDPTRTIAALMILAGFAFTASYLDDFFNGMASSRWPTAEARLLYTQEIDDAPWWWSLVWSRRHHNTAHAFRLYVGYGYLVDGQKYHSNAISFGSEFDTTAHQRHRFQYAKPLLAHYDPAAPGRAVLDAGMTLGSAWTTLGGAVVMLVGAILLVTSRAAATR